MADSHSSNSVLFKTGKKRSRSNSTDIQWLDTICNKRTKLTDQTSLIIKQIEAEPNYFERIPNICHDITETLKYFREGKFISAIPFGSGVTKLALKNSDIDIFLNFKDTWTKQSPLKFLHNLKRCISKKKFFCDAFAIPARVPIIRCKHRSGISCDLSYLNGLGVSNSNLIKFLLSSDKRIRSLILILKFFFQRKGLNNSNSLTSYALTMLIIYFLQQLKEPLIPAVSHLQKLATFQEITAGWDTSFSTEISHISTVQNHSSIVELISQFFQFYSTFEFGFYVISIFTGKTYLKPLFACPELLPEEFHCYKKIVKTDKSKKFQCKKPVCVQGPFNHSHNITQVTTFKILHLFQSVCFDSWKICEKALKEKEIDSELFKNLFTLSVDKNNIKFKSNETINISVGENINFDNSECSEEDLRYQWSESVLNLLKDILISIMKCKVKVESREKYNLELPKLETDEVLKLMRCELDNFLLVTKERNKVKQNLEFHKNVSIIEQEKIISDYLCDPNPTENLKTSFPFTITCVLKRNPTYMTLSLNYDNNSQGSMNFYSQIFKFLRTMSARIISSVLN